MNLDDMKAAVRKLNELDASARCEHGNIYVEMGDGVVVSGCKDCGHFCMMPRRAYDRLMSE